MKLAELHVALNMSGDCMQSSNGLLSSSVIFALSFVRRSGLMLNGILEPLDGRSLHVRPHASLCVNLVEKSFVPERKAVDFFECVERNGGDSTIANHPARPHTAAAATARGQQRQRLQVPEIRSMCAVNEAMKLMWWGCVEVADETDISSKRTDEHELGYILGCLGLHAHQQSVRFW